MVLFVLGFLMTALPAFAEDSAMAPVAAGPEHPPVAAAAPQTPLAPAPVAADALVPQPPSRQAATLVRDYHGAHEANFASDFDRLRLLTQQAQLEVSSPLGLINYRGGFQYPLNIRCADGAPSGLENALAYVQF